MRENRCFVVCEIGGCVDVIKSGYRSRMIKMCVAERLLGLGRRKQ